MWGFDIQYTSYSKAHRIFSNFDQNLNLKKRHNIHGIGRWNSFKSIYHEILALWAEERKSFETFDILRITAFWVQRNWILLLIVLWRNKNIADAVQWHQCHDWSPSKGSEKKLFLASVSILAGSNANFLWRPNSFRFQALHPSIFRTAANLPIIIIYWVSQEKMTFWNCRSLFVVAHPAWWLTV